jgi:hypothetical protein
MYDETVKNQRMVNDEGLGRVLAKETGGLNKHTPTTGIFFSLLDCFALQTAQRSQLQVGARIFYAFAMYI